MKKKKKSVVKKLRHLPENDNSYLDTMTGTNSSNDRAHIASKCGNKFQLIFFLRRIFGNEIVDHVEWKRHCAITKKMSELRDISNTSDIRFLMVYRTIIDVILHLFIICNDL